MKNPTLKQLVVAEATKLRDAITEIERERLNFEFLRPTFYTQCIYGQITGSCFSDRCSRLIELSCDRVYDQTDTPGSVLSGTLNGSPINKNRGSYWSPIELFIAQPENQENGNNEMLISFLKKERKTLRFK